MSIRTMRGATLSLTVLLGAAGCTDPVATGAGSDVAVGFHAAASSADGIAGSQASGATILTGANGTLRIDALHAIVDRFELKRVDDGRCAEEDHACERFRVPPLLVDLPLDGSSVIAVRQNVAADTYRRFRFEIEDLDDDEEDPARAQQIRELRSAIRARFPDWPRDASMLVTGTFTPVGGQPVAFRTYFEARIEIDRRLVPPVTIGAGADGGTFIVELDLTSLFGAGGTVRDLAVLDFGRTGLVPELRVEVENGFTRVEFRR